MPWKTVNGKRYPTVDASHLIYAKQMFDPDYYDEMFINNMFIQTPPKPERPHSIWLESMLNMQGIEL